MSDTTRPIVGVVMTHGPNALATELEQFRYVWGDLRGDPQWELLYDLARAINECVKRLNGLASQPIVEAAANDVLPPALQPTETE